MILQFTPIFFPIDSGSSAPMTAADEKIMLGIFIVMNIIWLISLIPFLIRSIKNLRFDYFEDRLEYGELWCMLDVVMGFIWLCILLVFCGSFVSNFL